MVFVVDPNPLRAVEGAIIERFGRVSEDDPRSDFTNRLDQAPEQGFVVPQASVFAFQEAAVLDAQVLGGLVLLLLALSRQLSPIYGGVGATSASVCGDQIVDLPALLRPGPGGESGPELTVVRVGPYDQGNLVGKSSQGWKVAIQAAISFIS